MGMNKIVVNHIEKLFVTNDAAKMVVMASMQQEEECGDGTNFVLLLAGSLLSNAEKLLRNGLALADIITGYKMARDEVLDNIL